MENQYVMPFEIKQTGQDDDFYKIEGIASTPDIDLIDDIVKPKGIMDSVEKRGMPAFRKQHNSSEGPIGVFDEIKQVGEAIVVKARMPKKDEKGELLPRMSETFALAKMGAFKGLSIGFNSIKVIWEESIRIIEELNLIEISLVDKPCNPQAILTGVKAVVPYKDLPLADREKEWDATAAMKRVRTFTGSEDAPTSKYKNAFLWYDSAEADSFGSYKLPYADVVDGKLVAVPRGVFAAAGAMSGARGGVDIPAGDRPGVASNINKYYAKMRKKFDDDSIVSPLEKGGKLIIIDGAEKLSDIEKILQYGEFSNKEAEKIISKIKELKNLGDLDNSQGDLDVSKSLSDFGEGLKKLKQTMEK